MAEVKEYKYFESQQPDEQIILLVRRHILALASVFAIAFIVYAIGFLAIFIFPFLIPSMVEGFAYNIYVLVISLIFLFNTVFLFSNWVLHYLYVCLLTTEHFVEIDQYALFGRKISTLTLDKIQDVTNDQHGLINTVFNLGLVQVQTAGELPNFIVRYVPDPARICQTVMETEEAYSNRHGIRGNGLTGNANQTAANSQTAPSATPENMPPQEPNIEYPGDEWKQ